MSAHADKTLHWKISGNINDTDTFPHIFSLETYSSDINSWTNFSRISCTNLSTKFIRLRTNSDEFFARKIGYVTNGLYCTSLDKHLSESFETLKEKTMRPYAKDV